MGGTKGWEALVPLTTHKRLVLTAAGDVEDDGPASALNSCQRSECRRQPQYERGGDFCRPTAGRTASQGGNRGVSDPPLERKSRIHTRLGGRSRPLVRVSSMVRRRAVSCRTSRLYLHLCCKVSPRTCVQEIRQRPPTGRS